MNTNLLVKVDALFMELGFSKMKLNDKITYFKEEIYIRVDYIYTFESLVLEYANGIEEAKNNVFEDGDLYPLKLGDKVILKEMKADLLNNL